VQLVSAEDVFLCMLHMQIHKSRHKDGRMDSLLFGSIAPFEYSLVYGMCTDVQTCNFCLIKIFKPTNPIETTYSYITPLNNSTMQENHAVTKCSYVILQLLLSRFRSQLKK